MTRKERKHTHTAKRCKCFSTLLSCPNSFKQSLCGLVSFSSKGSMQEAGRGLSGDVTHPLANILYWRSSVFGNMGEHKFLHCSFLYCCWFKLIKPATDKSHYLVNMMPTCFNFKGSVHSNEHL